MSILRVEVHVCRFPYFLILFFPSRLEMLHNMKYGEGKN